MSQENPHLVIKGNKGSLLVYALFVFIMIFFLMAFLLTNNYYLQKRIINESASLNHKLALEEAAYRLINNPTTINNLDLGYIQYLENIEYQIVVKGEEEFLIYQISVRKRTDVSIIYQLDYYYEYQNRELLINVIQERYTLNK